MTFAMKNITLKGFDEETRLESQFSSVFYLNRLTFSIRASNWEPVSHN